MTMRVLAAATALVAALALPAEGQIRGVRFEVVNVGDTTVAFRAGEERWIHTGDRGIAVDPRRRDALVARLRVLRVERGTATAVVTGQTTAVTTDHIVVFQEPRRRWYASKPFWGGIVAGVALGAVVGFQH